MNYFKPVLPAFTRHLLTLTADFSKCISKARTGVADYKEAARGYYREQMQEGGLHSER
jgi:hypothetical protein